MATQLTTAPRSGGDASAGRPHVVLVIPRGEAARNFIYSGTLPALAAGARVTVLSVVDDDGFREFCGPLAERVLPLREYPEHRLVKALRGLTHLAHFQKLGSVVAKETLARRIEQAPNAAMAFRRRCVNGLARCLGNQPSLRVLSALEREASWRLRRTEEFVRLFRETRPALVFNGSHIHGIAAEEPVRAAARLGIPTAAFVFSWDNPTSRGRILAPYDYLLTWHDLMRRQMLSIYPEVAPERVVITGTPQFDFHFKPEFKLDRAELCRRVGADPSRPFVLYTTGMDTHFPEEHRTVELAASILNRLPMDPKPQLIVRTYIKGTSREMKALAERKLPNVVFPEVLWEGKWLTPLYDDLAIYSSLLKHCSFGINAASTVSLELIMHDKPVINLGFDPPGSRLEHSMRFERHLTFDHYRPVVESGAVMVARSAGALEELIGRAFRRPGELSQARRAYMERLFGETLDGRSGERVAEVLLRIAGGQPERVD